MRRTDAGQRAPRARPPCAPRLLFKLWNGCSRLDALLVVTLVLAAFSGACPAPPATGEGEGEGASSEGEGAEGEGEGEGEGDFVAEGEGEGEGVGEGEGEGAGEGEGEGAQSVVVVSGSGLLLEDVARDGSELAYVDASGELFAVAPGAVSGGSAGSPVTVAVGTQLAQYHGDFLIAFHGLVAPSNKVAASADVRAFGAAGSTTTSLGSNVRVSSLDASDDGLHLYHEESPSTGGRDSFLDGVKLANFAKVKSRFTPDNARLIAGANVKATLAGGTATTEKLVRAYDVVNASPGAFDVVIDTVNDPTASPPVLGPSNTTQVTHDGTQVIFGDHEQSNRVDITIAHVDGSSPVVLAAGGDDIAFKVSVDDSEVIYLVDTVSTVNNAACGAIQAVHRDGSARRTIRAGDPTCASGAKDLKALSSTHLVYARAIAGSLEDLAIIAVDGSANSDTALGSNDVSVGFSKDGRFFAYLDGVSAGAGTLKIADTSTSPIAIHTVAANVLLAPAPAFGSSSTIVALDAGGSLHEATLDTTASGGAPTLLTIASGVSSFGVVRDGLGLDASRVAFSRAADGIFTAGL